MLIFSLLCCLNFPETLLVVAGLGIQTTATFYMGKQHTRFIPWGNVVDIIIAETISMVSTVKCIMEIRNLIIYILTSVVHYCVSLSLAYSEVTDLDQSHLDIPHLDCTMMNLQFTESVKKINIDRSRFLFLYHVSSFTTILS